MSILCQRSGNSGGEKRATAEAYTAFRPGLLGRRKRSCGLSHYVERYHSMCWGNFVLLP